MKTTRDPILGTSNLSIGYKNKIVAENLNLSVNRGELVCLLGPNGSGKSTLLRTLIGIQHALAGNVLIQEKPLGKQSPLELAKSISIVLTDKYAGNLSVREVVALGRTPYTGWLGYLKTIDMKCIYESLEKVGILDYADRKINELSDGERQRVMIAKALAQDTPVMLLDEPTAHLDLPNRIAILYLLRSLAKETGKAIVISMHELDIALQISDSVWIMSGNKIKQGPPEDMVLNGILKQTFTNEKIDFDIRTGTFNMLHPTTKEIYLQSNSIVGYWTQQALKKEGYRISSKQESIQSVHIISEELPRWEIKFNGKKKEVNSIKELLATLNNG